MTDTERAFIFGQGIQEALLYDAKGQAMSSSLESKMKSLGKVFAYNSTPCQSFGHTIRTRSGHCIQCDTAKIAFILRAVSFGCIYIAGSQKGNWMKVGVTSSKEVREESINREKYGNLDDWEVLFSGKCLNVGTVENNVHQILRGYAEVVRYIHDNHDQKTKELFRCGYNKAKNALDQVLQEGGVTLINELEKKSRLHMYDFRNLKKP